MTTPPGAIDSSAPQPAHVSAVGRLGGVLFNPKATFEDIAAKPSFVLPIVLLCVLSIVVIPAFGQRVGWRGVVERQMERSPRADQITQEQKDAAFAFWGHYGTYIVGGIAAVSTFVVPVVIAAVLLGVFNLIAGARIGFLQTLAIVSYSWMTFALHGILALIMVFVKAPDSLDIEHLVASNVGAFLSSDSPRWLTTLGTALDVFTFWTIVLMGIGFSAASPKKVSIGK